MKNFTKGLTKVCAIAFSVAMGLGSIQAQAQRIDVSQVLSQLTALDIADTKANLINWKVGDFHDIKIEFAFGGGTGKKLATKEDTAKNAIWLVTTISLMGQNQKTEVLYDRATGKVLEMIVNGKPQEVDGESGEVEILEQKETEITVPAGKFDCMYIKAAITNQGEKMEVEAWVNPIDVNLDGMLKTTLQTQIGPLSLILAKFGSKN